MARLRLRDVRPEGEAAYYARTYPGGYRHDRWPDHVERVAASVRMISRYSGHIRTAADLSCGDAAIIRGVPGLRAAWLGDLNGVTGLPEDVVRHPSVSVVAPGPLPETLDQLPGPVDLYVCSETIEHMDDPDELLRRLAGVATYLFLSTPLEEKPETGNPEHYWSWGQADMHQMLQDAGWTPLEVELLVPESTRHMVNAYTYQMWLALAVSR